MSNVRTEKRGGLEQGAALLRIDVWPATLRAGSASERQSWSGNIDLGGIERWRRYGGDHRSGEEVWTRCQPILDGKLHMVNIIVQSSFHFSFGRQARELSLVLSFMFVKHVRAVWPPSLSRYSFQPFKKTRGS